ncbi:unnamed protein product [Linum tenue]|uniref:UspA domain-containing protein n=1 Tax=Linum tenue TaxID=586396 RepID=A0AAV0NRP3_9ROSI|nr:unnamed protein product [Linum tenue]
MALARYLLAVPAYTSSNRRRVSILSSCPTAESSSFPAHLSSRSLASKPSKLPILYRTRPGKAKAQESGVDLGAADSFTRFKHLLLPVTDTNPYLSEGTRQAAATAGALAKKYEADITVVVGFQEFKLLERFGEGKKPTAIIGEVADDLNLDLVVISMEAIHSKHVDANLLAEFIPCPVLLLPL